MDSMVQKERLLKNRRCAEEEAAALCGQEELTYPFFLIHLRKYILYKLQLDPEQETEERIKPLLDLSLEKTLELPPEVLEEVKNAKTCDGAAETTIKKALLLQSIQRTLGIRLNAEKAVMALDVPGIAHVAWEAIKSTPAWEGKWKE